MDVYRIGVSLTLRNGISAGLRLIRHDLGGLMKALDNAQNSAAGFGKAMVKAGAVSALAGVGILDIYERIIRAGSKITSQQAAMMGVGVRTGQIAKNTSAAFDASTTLFNVSPQQAMAMTQMLRSMFGNSPEARAALLPVLKADVALDGNLHGHQGAGLVQALKALDITGALVSGKKMSVSALLANLPVIEQTMLLTHGMINGSQILRMIQQAGPAATATSFRQLLSSVTEATMALGPAVGRGLFTSYMVAYGGRANALSAQTMVSDNLIPAANVHKVKGSYVRLLDTNKIYGAAYLKDKGFLPWIHDKIIPKLQAEGFKSQQALTQQLVRIFPASTSARLISWVVHNWPQAKRYMKLIDQGIASGHPYTSLSQLNWAAATQNFEKAWNGLMTALGVPAVKSAVSALNAVSTSIHHMTAWLAKHPLIAKHIDQMLVALGAGLITFGAILASAGIVALLGTGGVLAALATAIGVVALAMMTMNWKAVGHAVSTAIHKVGQAIHWLLTPLRALGRVLGIGPITKADEAAGAPNVGMAALRKAGMGGKTGQLVKLGGLPMNGGHWVHHGSLLGGYDTWAPGPPPAASGAATAPSQPVHITNPGHLAKAIHTGLNRAASANQNGPTGFNPRQSAFGTPSFTGP